MPSVATPADTALGLGPRECIPVRESASGEVPRTRRFRFLLRDLAQGLNALLKLSDFSRGDIFRN